MTGSGPIDAERAFARETRARRRAALARRLRRQPVTGSRLAVVDERAVGGAGTAIRGVREIPVHEICATLEPSRAALFDSSFRPTPKARARWQRLWLAEHRGRTLPPIAVVPVADGYAVRDGHHRISVARARGALTIDATVIAA